MPVKKITTQKSAAKRSPKKSQESKQKNLLTKNGVKKISREERAHIRQAVDSLPRLLTQNVTEPFTETTPPPTPSPHGGNKTHRYTSSQLERKKRFLLNTVVGITMIFIAVLWVINVQFQFTNAKFHKGSDESLWQIGKSDFTNLVSEPRKKQKEQEHDQFFSKESTQQELSEEEIKNILVQNLSSFVSSSASTSTIETATSTPAVTTSTLTSTTTSE